MIAERWNHNLAYHGLILREVPQGASKALDVGAGDGTLARSLARRVTEVWALERDLPTLERARAEDRGAGVRYVHGDFLRCDLEPGGFDLVTCVAAIHHMDARAALSRLALALRPGGRLVVVGLARSELPADLPYEIAGMIMTRLYQATRGYAVEAAPSREATATYREIRALAEVLLPGVRYRRHVLWRYSLVWQRPA